MNTRKIVGHRMRELRGDMLQPVFAARLGVRPGTLQTYERGYKAPSLGMLVQIAGVLGCTTDYLLGRSERPWSDG
jgi:transcriptional regulator with XRE-family HTH domain